MKQLKIAPVFIFAIIISALIVACGPKADSEKSDSLKPLTLPQIDAEQQILESDNNSEQVIVAKIYRPKCTATYTDTIKFESPCDTGKIVRDSVYQYTNSRLQEYVLKTRSKKSGRYYMISTSKGIFNKLHVGDAVIPDMLKYEPDLYNMSQAELILTVLQYDSLVKKAHCDKCDRHIFLN